MRLRQVAFVAGDLEPVVASLNAVFGLNVAYRDPAVAVYGLINAVLPVGGTFLEVVQPVAADASAGRYLKRRGGDAGYMLIFQAPDAKAHRARLAAHGIRLIAQHDTPEYAFTHFHPGDFNGVLTSIDTEGDGASWQDPMGRWPPAGRDWRKASAPPDIVGIVGATVQARDPAGAARRWAEHFQTEVDPVDVRTLLFDGARVSFIEPRDADGTGIVGLDIEVRDPDAILKCARAHDVPVREGAVSICGVSIRPIR